MKASKRIPNHVRALASFIENFGAKVRSRLYGRLAFLEWSVGSWHASIKVPVSAPDLDRVLAKLRAKIGRMFVEHGAVAAA